MGKSLMKPFITDASENGKSILKFQCEGKSREQINETLLGSQITAYLMPDEHTFETAWLFYLFFSNGCLIEFSSACTEIGNWREIGSLNLRFDQDKFLDQKGERKLFAKNGIEIFYVNSIECLTFEDADVYAECGIVFCDSFGQEIIVAAGPTPGSISIRAPFSTGEFKPEFSMTEYKRTPI
jgi:hypothetical protein